MNTTKIKTNDIAAYIGKLDGVESEELIEASESKWNGLPVVVLALPNGTTAKFAVSSWIDRTGFDTASVSIARQEIEKKPTILPAWVVQKCAPREYREATAKMVTDSKKGDYWTKVLSGIINEISKCKDDMDSFTESVVETLGLVFFLDKAGYPHGKVYKATNNDGWCDTYIGIDEVEEKPKGNPNSTRLDFKAMVDAAIGQSSVSRYGLPIVKFLNGKEYLVARSKDERASACRAAVMEGIYKYRPDFLENATGVDAQAFALIQENMKPKDANLAILYIVHGTCGLDNLIDPDEKNLGDSNHLGCFLSPNGEFTTDFGYFFYEADMLYKKLD